MKREIYYVFCDYSKNISTVLHRGELKEYSGTYFMTDIKKGSKVFVNSLSTLVALYPGGESRGTKVKSGKKEVIRYNLNGIEFHSANALFGGSFTDICDIFHEPLPVYAMQRMVSKYGDPEKVSGTMASQAKKAFYNPIKKELWNDTKNEKRYINDIETYKQCYAGKKSGILTDVKETRYSECAVGFDKKSAYIGYLLSDKFPVGKIKKTKDYKKAQEVIKADEWYKIVVNGKLDYLPDYYDDRVNMTAIEYYDVKTLFIIGKSDLVKRMLSEKDSFLLYSTKVDYLHNSFRDRLLELYNIKNEMSKEDPNRFFIKTELDMIYGKGIQWKDFSSEDHLIMNYKGRGENYLLPHMSNSVCAHMRYDMAKVMIDRGEQDTIYADTDGIKLVYRDDIEDYFNNLNEQIIAKNREAGYDTDMGIWDFEGKYDTLAVFAKKVYCYELDGELTIKAAGMDEFSKEKLKNSFTCMRRWVKYGIPFFTKQIKVNKIEKTAIVGYSSTILNNERKVYYA